MVGAAASGLAGRSLRNSAAIAAARSCRALISGPAATNVVKHAKAGRAWVRVSMRAGAVRVEVGDDGAGGAVTGKGSGLTGLLDRVEACGGQLHVHSSPGEGTTIEATMPAAEPFRPAP
jgi:nitrate/nitrite-specific signal transduction histidine kinase